MAIIFISVIKLFLLLFTGFAARKSGVIDQQQTKGLSALLIRVTLPALIFTSMQKDFSPELFRASILITVLSFAVYGLYFIIALFTGKVIGGEKRDIGVYQFSIVFSNVGFLGFPVLGAVFGDGAVFFAAMFNIPFQFFVFTLGVYLMTRGHSEEIRFNWRLLLSPAIVMTVAGFLFFMFSLKLPGIIYEPLKMAGDITIPLSMITVGSMLTDVHPSELLAGWRVYLISFMRLILLPVIVFFFVSIFTSDPMIITVPVVLAAMPVAVNAPLIASEYDGNALLASRLMFLSTLLSLLTLPLVLMVLRGVLR